jgi:DNA-binding NarL/FixJ family response regulator
MVMSASSDELRDFAPRSGFGKGHQRVRRVLIVDDHTIVRQGLRCIVENQEDMMVCGEAETELEARAAIRLLDPDAMIADLSLQHGDGIELVRAVRSHHKHIAILVFSMHDEAIYAERMLTAGANGYIMKDAASDEFLISLRRVLDGGVYVSKAIAATMIEKMTLGTRCTSANPIEKLSNRELQILHMIGKGMSTREAAVSLNLSVKTVESHRQRLKRKLNVATSTRLVQYAMSWFIGREACDPTYSADEIHSGTDQHAA